tara:strand:- start:407 stop:610 length:204 start_codon:yes stop_codon:yes gene_type:complete
MASLYPIKCHKILENLLVEVAVEIAECFHIEVVAFVVFIELEESKILTSATNGDQDVLEDNGTNYYE